VPTLLERVKDRKLVQWLLAYVTAAWVVMQVLETLVGVVGWVDAIRPAVLTVLLLGLPIVLVLAWYHGEKGRQSVRGRELVVLATVLAVVGGGFWAFGRSPDEPIVVSTSREQISAAPAIAVLPAIAAGSDAEEVAEGIVSVLSTGLDEVEGWRAVSPRTVRARWNERIAEGDSPDEATALEIARATGARYAVLPTATVLGSSVRITADVFDLEAPNVPATTINVEGGAEALLPLADDLALQILRAVLLEEGEIPEIDLSRTSSESPEALRAFLRGEVAYRKFQLEDARDAFNLALQHDPGFARAHYRLYEVHNWGVTWDTQKLAEHRAAALEGIDRLTEREALVVRGLSERDGKERIRILREAVARYPDDATAWNLLGERLIHWIGIQASLDEITQAFDRALELDPYRAVLYGHPVILAFGERADSARATDLVTRFVAAASGVGGGSTTFDVDPRGGELALELAFGDPVTREAAWARLSEEVAAGRYDDLRAQVGYLGHPRYWDRLAPLIEMMAPDAEGLIGEFLRTRLFANEALWRGRLDHALTYLPGALETREGVRAVREAYAMGLPVHVETLDNAFGPDYLVDETATWRVALAGWHAADQGRWSDYDRALEILTSRIDPEVSGSAVEGAREAVRGYGIWKRGDPQGGLAVLEDVTGPGRTATQNAMWHLGELYLELERWSDAERVFSAAAADGISSPPFFWNPLVRRRLGVALEAQGRNAEAIEAYEYFLEHWYDPDLGLESLVEETRAAVRRLGGAAN
jgi:tetratricopeptide (TPR) repeat protein